MSKKKMPPIPGEKPGEGKGLGPAKGKGPSVTIVDIAPKGKGAPEAGGPPEEKPIAEPVETPVEAGPPEPGPQGTRIAKLAQVHGLDPKAARLFAQDLFDAFLDEIDNQGEEFELGEEGENRFSDLGRQ